jgi:1-acyl-sn-glycerol-3-phosphate acyltransferase
MMPISLISKKYAMYVSYIWAKYLVILIKVILKINYTVEGSDNIPKENCVIASNHQSAWETIFYLYYFKNPIFILKKELFYLPVIGFYCKRTGMVFIDRRKALESVKNLKKSFARAPNRKIIIFPEGTRVKYSNKVKFKSGVHFLSSNLKLRIIPSAHNAGKYWPKGMFNKKSGTVTIKFLSGLDQIDDKKNLIKTLENKIYSSI